MEYKLYIQNDLEDYASRDLPEIDRDGYVRPSFKRAELIKRAVNPDSFDYACVGSYQGSYAFVLKKGGYTWIIKESFGSCSHCDSLMAKQTNFRRSEYSIEEALDIIWDYTLKMLRNAYCFETEADAISYLEQKDGWTWRNEGLASDAIEIVKEI